jgi:hypothetical protein
MSAKKPVTENQIISENQQPKAKLAVTGVNTSTPPAMESAGFCIVLVSFLAGAIGLVAGCIAFLLYKLIGLFTDIAFYGHFSANFVRPRGAIEHLDHEMVLVARQIPPACGCSG